MVTAQLDAVEALTGKHIRGVRFNVRFEIRGYDASGTEGILADWYPTGFRVMNGLIYPPSYGPNYANVFYLDTAHAMALVEAVVAREGDLRPKCPEAFPLAPPAILCENLTLPLTQFARLYPNVARAMNYQRG